MADHRFHVVVDLIGNEPTEIDALLRKGREHNFTASGHGFVRNSRDYEWGYTLHKDAVRAARRFWKLLSAHNEKHAAVYIRHVDGTLEVVWNHGEVGADPSVTTTPEPTWFEKLRNALNAFSKGIRNEAVR